jgi:bifunctional pyridoxal-dependent enzyme with beta-cystathionase and maltose regulon repressor activities
LQNQVYPPNSVVTVRPYNRPCLDDLAVSAILTNSNFLSNFLKVHRERLEDRYTFCTTILKVYEIPYGRSTAGNYVWIDLSNYVDTEPGDSAFDRERSLSTRLIDGGIHLTPVDAFPGGQTGWFRINIAIDVDTLEVGFTRYPTALSLLTAGC